MLETAILVIIGLLALALIIKRVFRSADTGDCDGCPGGCCDPSSCAGKKPEENHPDN